jgi:hypothetical protein
MRKPVFIYAGRVYSSVEYARIIGAEDALAAALALAGWSSSNISDLVDEGIYLGIPKLMDGIVDYESQDECRAEFVEN